MWTLLNQRNNAIQQMPTMLGKFFLWIAVFFGLYIASGLIVAHIQKRIMANNLEESVYSKKNAEFVGKIIYLLCMIFAILISFQFIGFDASIIMWGISLSLWFAMQSTVENLVSGIFILTNKKIRLGEFVQFMGPLNLMGTIEEINIRYTVIRSFDKRRIILPNSLVAKTPIRTMKSEPLLRGEIVFIVPRHTPVDQFKKTFIDTINRNKYILYPEYTSIMINNFTNSGIEIKGFFFVNPAKKSPIIVARDIKSSLFEELKPYGIKVPYPHLSLTVE